MPCASHYSCGDCSSSMWRGVQITVLFNTGGNTTAAATGNFNNILQGANSHWRMELQDGCVLPGYESVSVGDHTPVPRGTVGRWLLDGGASLPPKKGVFIYFAKESPDIRKPAESTVYRQLSLALAVVFIVCTASYQARRLFLTCPRRPGRCHLSAVTQWRTVKYLGHQRNALLTHVSLITPQTGETPSFYPQSISFSTPHPTVYRLCCFHACIPDNAGASCQLLNWCYWGFKPSAEWHCAVHWMVSGDAKTRLAFVFKGNLCQKKNRLPLKTKVGESFEKSAVSQRHGVINMFCKYSPPVSSLVCFPEGTWL
jgi:hypothetical protein